MSVILKLQKLEPVNVYMENSDGVQYRFLPPKEFDLVAEASQNSCMTRMTVAINDLEIDDGNVEAAMKYTEALRDYVSVIIPGMPITERHEYTANQLQTILDGWRDHFFPGIRAAKETASEPLPTPEKQITEVPS